MSLALETGRASRLQLVKKRHQRRLLPRERERQKAPHGVTSPQIGEAPREAPSDEPSQHGPLLQQVLAGRDHRRPKADHFIRARVHRRERLPPKGEGPRQVFGGKGVGVEAHQSKSTTLESSVPGAELTQAYSRSKVATLFQ